MKRFLLLLTLLAFFVSAGAAESLILLPKAEIGEGTSLNSALLRRQTNRSFRPDPLPAQTLANLLWAANGSNRENGKRTIPAALGRYAVSLFVILPEGIYRYDRGQNSLSLVAAGDFREASDGRKMGMSAGAVLVLVADRTLFPGSPNADAYIGVEAGAMVQNLHLVAAAENLHAVVCGSFNADKLNPLLKLPAGHSVFLTMVIGFPQQGKLK